MDSKEKVSDIEKWLHDKFPEGNVCNLSKVWFYKDLLKSAKELEISPREYVARLGFNYTHKTITYTLDSIDSDLLRFYPDKKIETLTDIFSQHPSLYNCIRKHCELNNISNLEFLISKGYVIENSKYVNSDGEVGVGAVQVPYSNFDVYTLKLLRDNYEFNSSKLSIQFGKSRQDFNNKLRVQKVDFPSWGLVDFTEEETDYIIGKLEKREIELYDDENDVLLYIYFGTHNKEDIAVLLKWNGIFKCHFKFNDKINQKLMEHGYCEYYLGDFKILKTIAELNSGTELYLSYEHLKADNRLHQSIRLQCKIKSLSIQDYLETLNVIYEKGQSNITYTPKVISEILKEYVDSENRVSIPTSDSRYLQLRTIAKRRGYGNFSSMVQALGFKLKKRYKTEEEKKLGYIAIIKERYVIEGNRIYINYLDHFYSSLASFCMNRDIKLDDYLADIGFIRLSSAKDLPPNFKLYDWKQARINKMKTSNVDDKIVSILEELSDEDDNIYLDTNSNVYLYLVKVGMIRSISVNDIITKFGYTRVYKKRKDSSVVVSEAIPEDIDERVRIKTCITELERLEAENKTTNRTSFVVLDKVVRNQKLVKVLKDVYSHRCQLCCHDEGGFKIPTIEDESGRPYSEMHHITQLSETESDYHNDDTNLDTFRNGLIMCCFHHKYVHKHLGGFKKLVKDCEGVFYLQSDNKMLVRIYENQHLTDAELIDLDSCIEIKID